MVVPRRSNASPACWGRRTDVLAFEFQHLAQVGRLHQLAVDAYGAQHGGDQTPAISVPFALIGLHLALDLGWSGNAVRGAHKYLADRSSAWPAFAVPEGPAWMTVADVAVAATPEDYSRLVKEWAVSVWAAWAHERDGVQAWARASLPGLAGDQRDG